MTDANSSAAIAGATVQVGTSIHGGVLSGIVATTTTNATGAFTLPSGNATWIVISADAAHAILHRGLPNPTGTSFPLAPITSADTAALAESNGHRATTGAPALTIDSDLTTYARARVNDEATYGYYAHIPPSGDPHPVTIANALCTVQLQICQLSTGYEAENLATGPSLVYADDAYFAEGPTGGHYAALMASESYWIGYGLQTGITPPGGIAPQTTYESEEFWGRF